MAKNKSELLDEALGLGLAVTDEWTKAQLAEAIDAKYDEMAANVMGDDVLLGSVPSRFRGGRGDQNIG